MNHLYYHNQQHVQNLIRLIKPQNDTIRNAVVWHDFGYDPHKSNDENVDYAIKIADLNGNSKEVLSIIDFTRYNRKPETDTEHLFYEHDFKAGLLEHMAIFKEYQWVGIDFFKEKRLEFIIKAELLFNDNFSHAKATLLDLNPRIAIYPGSFAPFHNGHLDILRQAEHLFDQIIIAVGINPEKQSSQTNLAEVLKYHQVISFDNSLASFTKSNNYNFIIRGLRNGYDYDYEQKLIQATLNYNPDLQFVMLPSAHEFDYLSSTMINALKKSGEDIAQFTPTTKTVYAL